MDAIMKRLGEMNQLLLALNDNVAANNRHFDRIDETLRETNRRLERIDNKLGTLELQVMGLGVRISALETADEG